MSNKKSKKNSNTKKKNKTRKSKMKTLLIFAIILIVIALGIFLYTNRTEPSLALKEYFSYLSEKNYEAMYDFVETNL